MPDIYRLYDVKLFSHSLKVISFVVGFLLLSASNAYALKVVRYAQVEIVEAAASLSVNTSAIENYSEGQQGFVALNDKPDQMLHLSVNRDSESFYISGTQASYLSNNSSELTNAMYTMLQGGVNAASRGGTVYINALYE